ncbi:hypothetical protein MCEMSEM23_00961 [Rhabdaerophilaceae bacterium]
MGLAPVAADSHVAFKRHVPFINPDWEIETELSNEEG